MKMEKKKREKKNKKGNKKKIRADEANEQKQPPVLQSTKLPGDGRHFSSSALGYCLFRSFVFGVPISLLLGQLVLRRCNTIPFSLSLD